MEPGRRTKIVCTVGPASRSPEMLERLLEAGMNVARLNFSHGSREEHGLAIEAIRSIGERLERPVAILQDLAGFKIRVGNIPSGAVLLEPGATFTLTTGQVEGGVRRVSVSYPGLPDEVRPGDTLLLSDGNIELVVEAVSGTDVECRVLVGGALSSRKGVNVSGRAVGQSGLTDKDRADLAFGLQREVDFVALSFVRSAADIDAARELITRGGEDTPIIAKIENQDALDNIDEIIDAADGIMVARGDLGVGTPVARIPQVQKTLIAKANDAGKPVITATQMLRSMVDSPRPTRAEVTDVANAILDGTDAVMLSEETAVGSYPVESVRMMAEVAREIEASFPYDAWLSRAQNAERLSVAGAIAASACALARNVEAVAILSCTTSGSTARSVARCRPRHPVLALTPRITTYRRLALTWGVVPRLGKGTASTDQLARRVVREAADAGLFDPGQRAVITAGVPAGSPGNTNLIKVEEWAPGDPAPD